MNSNRAIERCRNVDNATRYRLALEAARLALVSDAFIGLVFYRCKARLQALGIPVLPRLANRLTIATAGVSIGTPVLIEAGIYLPHGQVIVDGFVKVGAGTAIRPWVTIGLLEGVFEGPKIGREVRIGTGAKILGPVKPGPIRGHWSTASESGFVIVARCGPPTRRPRCSTSWSPSTTRAFLSS